VWSEHVGKASGESLCQVEHVGLVVSGRAAVKMADGSEHELGPGDLFHVEAGHDSWVIGDEPYVSLHFLGATDYAKR
jgi:quercetin dioxygenase-like cupin family protein